MAENSLGSCADAWPNPASCPTCLCGVAASRPTAFLPRARPSPKTLSSTTWRYRSPPPRAMP
eukprot:238915-Alexandrium_andersonii.AAC.1